MLSIGPQLEAGRSIRGRKGAHGVLKAAGLKQGESVGEWRPPP